MKYQYRTKGTCSQLMDIEIDDEGVITNLTILGGCKGNLAGIMALVKGKKAVEIAQTLRPGRKITGSFKEGKEAVE